MAQASCTNNTNLVAQDVTDANGFYFMWEKALSTSGTVDPETARGLIRSRASGASVVPLDSPTGGYSFDGEREGVVSAAGATQ